MYDWQKKFLMDIETHVESGKELKIMMAGRRQGKSMFSAAALKRLMDDLYKPQPVEELVFSEGRVHGGKYHCVEPIGGNWKDMEAWCTTAFGEPGEIWPNQDFVWPDSPRWMQNNRKFWFRNEKDKTMFIMRWSR